MGLRTLQCHWKMLGTMWQNLSEDVESETSIKYPRTVSIWTIIGCVSGHYDEHGTFIRSHWQPIIQALANFSDGYQQNLVHLHYYDSSWWFSKLMYLQASSTNVIFNHLFGKELHTSAVQTRISNSLLVGSVIDILFSRYISDLTSRKGGMLATPS